MTDARTELVAAGYEAIADTWEAWAERVEGDPRTEWLNELVSLLPDRARVLELGCGGGTTDTRGLARRFRVTGVDLSAEQVRRARERVAGAEFRHADFTEVSFEGGSFDAVVALYSFNHVPRQLLGDVLGRIRSWLEPGGLLLATFGVNDTEGWTGGWLGATTYFSSWPPPRNRRLLLEARFELLRDELVTIHEPEGDATFQWVLARG